MLRSVLPKNVCTVPILLPITQNVTNDMLLFPNGFYALFLSHSHSKPRFYFRCHHQSRPRSPNLGSFRPCPHARFKTAMSKPCFLIIRPHILRRNCVTMPCVHKIISSSSRPKSGWFPAHKLFLFFKYTTSQHVRCFTLKNITCSLTV